MIQVRKFWLKFDRTVVIGMQSGAEILTVQLNPAGDPVLWAKVAVLAPPVKRIFRWRETDEAADEVGIYVGTVQSYSRLKGELHLFVDRER